MSTTGYGRRTSGGASHCTYMRPEGTVPAAPLARSAPTQKKPRRLVTGSPPCSCGALTGARPYQYAARAWRRNGSGSSGSSTTRAARASPPASAFAHIVEGDYLEGGLTGDLMLKDVLRSVDLMRSLGVPCLNAAEPLASFGAAGRLGYSNRVVDAIGDLAGGVRLHDERSD